MSTLVALSLMLSVLVQASPRTVEGTYRLPAKGFSVVVPSSARGVLPPLPEVERGVGMELPSGGFISVFAEPNSLEWRSPADGIRWVIGSHPECASGGVHTVVVGKIRGSGARVACDNRVLHYRLIFRPQGGEPIYWLNLRTDVGHESGDMAIQDEVAASFRIIKWQ